jgi:hypothetical protein
MRTQGIVGLHRRCGSRDYAVRDAEGFVWCFGTYAPGSSEPAS